jgi:ATP-dependent metalloprotease FtsH
VGVGASRVRDMFEQGKKNAPCIIFIDEIDAVGRHRGAGLGGGNDEREQTLNQLLVEMDGFEANEGVILIAATNRPDVLDPALLRPGRFDRQVVVPNPDILGREKILKVHMRKVPLAPDVDARVIARGTPGFSGADLANLVNEAALLAARSGKRVVTMVDFETAKDKVMMGAERRSMVMTEEEKELTAHHEAGHALVGLFVPGNDPLHKVTIIPRGRALGVTMNLPERDRYGFKKNEITAKLAMMFGGRVAEELIYGPENVTTGASNDIQQATNMARAMVTEWGMSDKLGRLRYVDNQEEIFLGHSVTRSQTISGETAKMIDNEVRRIIEEAEAKAREVLSAHMEDLQKVTKGQGGPGDPGRRADRPFGSHRDDRRERPALLGALQRQARQGRRQGPTRRPRARTPARKLKRNEARDLDQGGACGGLPSLSRTGNSRSGPNARREPAPAGPVSRIRREDPRSLRDEHEFQCPVPRVWFAERSARPPGKLGGAQRGYRAEEAPHAPRGPGGRAAGDDAADRPSLARLEIETARSDTPGPETLARLRRTSNSWR